MRRAWPCLLAALCVSTVLADELPPGALVRVYDLGSTPSRLPRLVDGQLPDEQRVVPVIDLVDTRGDFGALKEHFQTVVTARLQVPETGFTTLRLTADDGARLWLNGREVIDHDGLHPPTAKDAKLYLYQGAYRLEVQQFQGGGGAALKLEWQLPNATGFTLVPATALSTPAPTMATAPGRKASVPRPAAAPGDGADVPGVHPGYDLAPLRPEGFAPQVAGLGWLDGDLLIASRASGGELYRLEGALATPGKPQLIGPRIPEPLGLVVREQRVEVLTGQGLVAVYPAYRNWRWADLRPAEPNGFWQAGPGLLDGRLIAFHGPFGGPAAFVAETGPTSRPPTLTNLGGVAASGTGSLLATSVSPAGGGQLLAVGPDGASTPVAWLPDDVVAQPTQPAVAPAGPYAGQVFVGDLSLGGIKRVFLDRVGGVDQGALFRFTQGLEAGVSRLLFAPDGTLIVGGDGGSADRGELGKPGYGLQRLTRNATAVFEPLAIRARSNGLEVELSEPLPEREGWDPTAWRVRSFVYRPGTAEPRSEERRVAVASASVSADRRRVFLELPDLQAGTLVHLRLPHVKSEAGHELWSAEAWYTLTRRGTEAGQVLAPPEGVKPNTLTAAERADGWRLLFDGEGPKGWHGFRRKTFPERGWVIEDGTLHCLPAAGGGDLASDEQFGSFEFSVDIKCAPGTNSGLMWRVTEDISPSWFSGPEVQIYDGSPGTGVHDFGALYELYPPTVKAYRPAGEWNQLRIVLNGDRGEHWLNGTKIVEYTLHTDDWNQRVAKSKFKDPRFGNEPKGHLVLQDHGDEVWFRNLKLRELPRP